RQHGLQQIHQFIVVNHILISHIASLTQQLQDYRYQLKREILKNLVVDIERNFDIARARLNHLPYDSERPNPNRSLKFLNQQAEELMEKRKKEIEAGQIETETLKPLIKMKSVVNQYNFIFHMSVEMEKVASTLKLVD